MTDPISLNRGPMLYQEAYAARHMWMDRLVENLNTACREQLASGKPSEDNGKLMLARAIKLTLQEDLMKQFSAELEQYGIET